MRAKRQQRHDDVLAGLIDMVDAEGLTTVLLALETVLDNQIDAIREAGGTHYQQSVVRGIAGSVYQARRAAENSGL